MAEQTKSSGSRIFSTLSGETLVFLALFLAIALAGFNSGNNLLYLISGIMLAGILVSLGAGYINLSRISIVRRLPNHVFCGQSFKVALEIVNRKKHFNSYGLTLIGSADNGRKVFIPAVRKQDKLTRVVEISLSRRGLHRFDPIIIASRFPWGLFESKRKRAADEQLIVYPPVYEMSRVITGSSRIRDEFPQFSKGPGSGLYGLREYRHGEDIANISWKLSAKLDKLIVRETEAEEKKRVCVIFDNVLDDRSEADLEAFERSVSAAASLVWYLFRNGYMVKLVTRDRTIGYGAGPDQMHKMLIVLALIQPISHEEDGIVLDKRLFEGGTGVLIHCAGAKQAPRPGARDFAVVIAERARAGSV